ncbi:hypothetical protein ACFE04_017012 [Oxalis oulophora]
MDKIKGKTILKEETDSDFNNQKEESDFPVTGLRVLVVDQSKPCLMVIEKLLRRCQYEEEALVMLRDGERSFDIILTNLFMPYMDGLKLMEFVKSEMELPVVIMSECEDNPKINHDYMIIKPIQMETIQLLWQLVKNLNVNGERNKSKSIRTGQKFRIEWTIELHTKFMIALKQLGVKEVKPSKILEKMKLNGLDVDLTKDHISSHLQKYRLYVKKNETLDEKYSWKKALTPEQLNVRNWIMKDNQPVIPNLKAYNRSNELPTKNNFVFPQKVDIMIDHNSNILETPFVNLHSSRVLASRTMKCCPTALWRKSSGHGLGIPPSVDPVTLLESHLVTELSDAVFLPPFEDKYFG